MSRVRHFTFLDLLSLASTLAPALSSNWQPSTQHACEQKWRGVKASCAVAMQSALTVRAKRKKESKRREDKNIKVLSVGIRTRKRLQIFENHLHKKHPSMNLEKAQHSYRVIQESTPFLYCPDFWRKITLPPPKKKQASIWTSSPLVAALLPHIDSTCSFQKTEKLYTFLTQDSDSDSIFTGK